MERLIVTWIVLDIADPLPNEFMAGCISMLWVKSPNPEFQILGKMIGMDMFVDFSMAKANTEKEYQSFGVKYG